MCVLIFSTILFETFLILRRIQQDVVTYVKLLNVKYQLFLLDFIGNGIFSTIFCGKLKYQISSKSAQWQPSCVHVDRQTDRQTEKDGHDEANSNFFQFANAPSNEKGIILGCDRCTKAL